MDNYQEIVTKAVIGKSKKTSKNEFKMTTENIPNTILGCWVINNKFDGYQSGESITVNGSFDVNVWYSYDSDSKTAVSSKNFSYTDVLKVHLKEPTNDSKEVIVRSLKQPTVTDVKVENGEVNLTIEKEMGVEVVGNTKIKVPTQIVEDDYEDLSYEDNIDKVDENYIN